ncbi:carbohydrate ABC transporter permease [Proteus sp. FME41]|uniref:carbohydrate ABC transporter permease n=1 Tax=Proteus sp. FME41 TaxID=2742608 RepID=UPI00186825CE|nr:sugar ABC transporter permease [Proteus sp. FME41]
MKNKNILVGYLFLFPWIIYFVVFILYPFFLSFQNSFLDINVLTPENTQFVGIKNWVEVSTDGLFWKSIFNVIFNQVIFVFLTFIVAMGMALLLHEVTHFGGVFRTIMFIPVITSITVAMIIFNFISSPTGPIQSLMLDWNMINAPVFWKFDEWLPMPMIAVFSTWKWFGIQMIIFLGGIASINRSLYEAADIDGASWLRKMWSITLPLLKPQIIFVMTINIINGMQMFVEVLMNFDLSGGPYNSALTPVLYLYKTGFSDVKMGMASTIGLLLATIIYIFTMLQLKLTQDKEHR